MVYRLYERTVIYYRISFIEEQRKNPAELPAGLKIILRLL